jgi:hypothetical protein
MVRRKLSLSPTLSLPNLKPCRNLKPRARLSLSLHGICQGHGRICLMGLWRVNLRH